MKAVLVDPQLDSKNIATFEAEVVVTYKPSTKPSVRSALKKLDEAATAIYGEGEEFITADQVIDGMKPTMNTNHQQFVESMKDFIQKWANHRCESVSPITAKKSIWIVREFLDHKGIELSRQFWKKIHFAKVAETVLHSFSPEELQQIIEKADAPYDAYFMALISSGMRGGEAVQVLKRDAELVGDHLFINIRGETTKTLSARQVILSAEATLRILPRYKEADNAEYLFLHHLKVKSWISRRVRATDMFRAILADAGLASTHAAPHRLRAYFFKVASNLVYEDYAHGMMGHKGHLKNYGLLTDQERVNLYLKAEEGLTVMETAKVRAAQAAADILHNAEISEMKTQLEDLQEFKRNATKHPTTEDSVQHQSAPQITK